MLNVPRSSLTLLTTNGWFSGSISVSPSGTSILVHNLANGFDLYEISAGTLTFRERFGHEHWSGLNIRLPCLFLHQGEAVSGGSSCGDLVIWQTSNNRRAMTLGTHGVLFVMMLSLLLLFTGSLFPGFVVQVIKVVENARSFRRIRSL